MTSLRHRDAGAMQSDLEYIAERNAARRIAEGRDDEWIDERLRGLTDVGLNAFIAEEVAEHGAATLKAQLALDEYRTRHPRADSQHAGPHVGHRGSRA